MKSSSPIRALCQRLAETEVGPLVFVLAAPIVAAGRGIAERFAFPRETPFRLPFLNYLLCYLLLQLSMMAVLAAVTRSRFTRHGAAVSAGLLLGWLPPIIDWLLLLAGYRQPDAWYLYPGEWTWHFFAGYQKLGESITVWLTVSLVALYAGVLKKRVLPGLLAAVGVWLVFQLVGFWLPELAREAARRDWLVYSHAIDWVYLWAGVAIWWIARRRQVGRSLGRFVSALPFAALAALGARLVGGHPGAAAFAAGIVALTGFLALVENDWLDRESDSAGGHRPRPVGAEDFALALVFHGLLLWRLGIQDPGSVVFIALFIFVWLAYSAPGIRLKRFPIVPYLCEGVAAATCLLFGVHYGGGGVAASGEAFPYAVAAFFGFAVASPVKDVKDYLVDRAAGIPTVFVLAGADPALRLGRARLLAALSLFAMLLVPAAVLWTSTGGEAWISCSVLLLLALAAGGSVAVIGRPATAVFVGLLFVSLHLFAAAVIAPELITAG
ncbi:MAG: UbiA family prenyltransferase [Polyangia bacterium]